MRQNDQDLQISVIAALLLKRKPELEIICTGVCVGSSRGKLTMQLHMRRALQDHKCV